MNTSNDTYVLPGGRPATRPWLSQITARLHQVRASAAGRRARAREMQDLYRCSDRDLHDMGLSRSDFLAIQNGSFRRD